MRKIDSSSKEVFIPVDVLTLRRRRTDMYQGAKILEQHMRLDILAFEKPLPSRHGSDGSPFCCWWKSRSLDRRIVFQLPCFEVPKVIARDETFVLSCVFLRKGQRRQT
jgi:hypothetical protein